MAQNKMNENFESLLIDGNLKFQWKLIKESKEISFKGKIPKYPILILTCMDPRIDVFRIFQLEPGDVFVLRNAGNLITTDMLRSILLAVYEFEIKNIIILGHLDCGMTKIRINLLKLKLSPKAKEFIFRTGHNQEDEMREFFKSFIDTVKNLRNQVEILENFKGLPSKIIIKGMLYDVDTGLIFEEDLMKDIEFFEEFSKKYQELLQAKRIQLVDYLETIEPEIIGENKPEIKINAIKSNKIEVSNNMLKTQVKKSEEEESQISATENLNLINDMVPKIPKLNLQIKIPTLYVPKIKIHTNVMSREKTNK